jgi:hypothetical protein
VKVEPYEHRRDTRFHGSRPRLVLDDRKKPKDRGSQQALQDEMPLLTVDIHFAFHDEAKVVTRRIFFDNDAAGGVVLDDGRGGDGAKLFRGQICKGADPSKKRTVSPKLIKCGFVAII